VCQERDSTRMPYLRFVNGERVMSFADSEEKLTMVGCIALMISLCAARRGYTFKRQWAT